MRKEIDRVFTVFAFQMMGRRHATCDHICCTFLARRCILVSSLKIPLDKLNIFGKTGN